MQYKRVSQLAPGLMPIRRLLPALALFLSSMSMTSTFLMPEAPRLGLGLAALGRPGYINLDRAELGEAEERKPEAMQARAWRVLDRAWDLGVRYFDCARSYGRSEEFLSNWLQHKQLRPEEIAVGSKWGYRYTADWRINTKGEPHEVKDHSLSHLDKQEQETKAFLGPHLRLYQIHSATLESGVLDNAEVLARLRSLREENGWRIGLSLSGVGQAATLKKALATEVFDAVQATWNLAEQSCGSALEEARRLGLEVIIKEGMANGRLLRRSELLHAAEALGAPEDALALAAAMVQPFRPLVLSGAVTEAQLESNMQAVPLCKRLLEDPSVLAKLMTLLQMDPAEYWNERSNLDWN